MKHALLGFAVLAGAIGAGCSTQAPGAAQPAARTPASFDAALTATDIASVRSVAADLGQPQAMRDLAEGAISYWQMQDGRAGPLLESAARDPGLSPRLRRDASVMLSGLRLRETRYADALKALDAAVPQVSDAEDRAELESTRSFIAPLAGVPRMQVVVGGPSSLTLTKDATAHLRAPVGINGGVVDTIVDTGSGTNTISAGNAKRLGLRMISGEATVGTATSASVKTGLAVADKLNFGGAEFRNVVFIVLPDEALTFVNGSYVVQAIVGMPILMPLGRVEITKIGEGKTQTLSYGPGREHPGANSNLVVESVEPFVSARANDSAVPLRFFIDNGAPTSHFNRRFVADMPAIAATGHKEAITTTGGAGSETQADAMRLPSVVLHVGGASASLANVAVTDDRHRNRHGDIGLDVLESGRGYVFDFDAMRLELLR